MTSITSTAHSKLWGKQGELWAPNGRLPDFSFAGYHSGECPIPRQEAVTCVTKYGAIGDGKTDCTNAFKQAIAATDKGLIEIPEGRFLISDILWIKKSGIVLHGAGTDKTVIIPTKKLEVVRPDMAATTEGLPTSSYSWSGGFLWIKGARNDKPITTITTPAVRGDRSFTVCDASSLSVGQVVCVSVQDSDNDSITRHLYAEDPGKDITGLNGSNKTSLIAKICAITDQQITIERPLRFDLRPDWQPRLTTYEPTVSECGIENLSIEFPLEAYAGHFKELGLNGIAIESASDCWVRDVLIRNADSGIFLESNFSTLENITLESSRPDIAGDTGHHGISFTNYGQDNLLQHFDIRTQFIHDITVENMTCGNVIKHGQGPNLSLDHHRWSPHDNLFCQIDVGSGSLIWRFGGGLQRGKHTGRGATFWGIHSEQSISHPGPDFGPKLVNFVGIHSSLSEHTDLNDLWWETIAPEALAPTDLHAAQLHKRINKPKTTAEST